MTQSLEDLVKDPAHAEGFKQLFALMRASAFTSLTYEFDGSGDSGNLERAVSEYETLHEGNNEVTPESVSCSLILKEPNGETAEIRPDGKHEWVTIWNDVQATNLAQLGYYLAELVLNNDPHDWYNNDGGFGTIVFSTTPENENHIFVDMNTREVISNAHPDEVTFANG